MTTVAISQPMFLPWIGLFEQIRIADLFVHYDDVQLPQGRSLMSRIQIRSGVETSWMSAQINRAASGGLISNTELIEGASWRKKHLNILRHTYGKYDKSDEMLALAQDIYSYQGTSLSEFNIGAIESIARALGIQTEFLKSSDLGIAGNSTERLVSICKHLDATRYITGHGARNYVDHHAFEAVDVEIEYMSYHQIPWPQRFEPFTPYVTVLDAVASVGAMAVPDHMGSTTTPWREFAEISNVTKLAGDH